VTILDGRNVRSNYYRIDPSEFVTVTGSSLHVLSPGARFDLNTCRLADA
jgi:hypothetical protein